MGNDNKNIPPNVDLIDLIDLEHFTPEEVNELGKMCMENLVFKYSCLLAANKETNELTKEEVEGINNLLADPNREKLVKEVEHNLVQLRKATMVGVVDGISMTPLNSFGPLKNSGLLFPTGYTALYPSKDASTLKGKAKGVAQNCYLINTNDKTFFNPGLEDALIGNRIPKKDLLDRTIEEVLEERVHHIYVSSANKKVLKIKDFATYRIAREIFGLDFSLVGNEENEAIPINFENVSRFFGGIYFTKKVIHELSKADISESCGLHKITRPVILYFNDETGTTNAFNSVPLSGTTDITNLVNHFKEMHRLRYATEPKLKQIYIRSCSLNKMEWRVKDNQDIVVLSSKDRKFVGVAENEFLRSCSVYSDKIYVGTGKDGNALYKEGLVCNTFVKMSYVENVLEDTIALTRKYDAIIRDGFWDELFDQTLHISLQSASDNRTRKFVCTPLQCHEAIALLTYNVKQFQSAASFNVSKATTRASLKLSSSIVITNFHPSVKKIEDPEIIMEVTASFPTGVDKNGGPTLIFDANNRPLIEMNKPLTISTKPSDGQGGISVEKGLEINAHMGKISWDECNFVLNNFTSLEAIRERVSKIATELTGTLKFKSEKDYTVFLGKNGKTTVDLKVNLMDEYSKTFDMIYSYPSKFSNYLSQNDIKILEVLNKCAFAFQVRYCSMKGLLIVVDFKYYKPEYKDFDILAGNGMLKYDYDDYDKCEFSVCACSKKASKKASTSYQYVQSLDLKPEQLIGLAKEALEPITEGIMVDANKAQKFLGMIANSDYEEDDEFSSYSKLSETLSINPDFIHEQFVQRSLKNQVAKFIYQLGFGKIPVEASYHYCCTDLMFFIYGGDEKQASKDGIHFMNADECYLNNQTTEVGLFRSPNLHREEVQVVNLKVTSHKYYWYLKDVIVFNAKSPILKAAGGADCDGDKFFVCYNKTIIEGINKNNCLLINEDADGLLKPAGMDNKEAFSYHFNTATKVNNIGRLSYNAAIYRDQQQVYQAMLRVDAEVVRDNSLILPGKKYFGYKILSDSEKSELNRLIESYDCLIALCACCTGWEIDRPKTNQVIAYVKAFYCKRKPAWLVGNSHFKKNSKNYVANNAKDSRKFIKNAISTRNADGTTKEATVYSTSLTTKGFGQYIDSPMSCLYEFINNFAYKFLTEHAATSYIASVKKNTNRQCINRVLSTRALNSSIDKVEGYVETLEQSYRDDVRELLEEIPDAFASGISEENDNEFRIRLGHIRQYYSDLCFACTDNVLVLAGAVYNIVNNPNRGNSSDSFMWSVVYEEMLELFKLTDNARKIICLPRNGEYDEFVKVNFNGSLFSNGKFVKNTNLPRGSYSVFYMNNTPCIQIARKLSSGSELLDAKRLSANTDTYHLAFENHNITTVQLAEAIDSKNIVLRYADNGSVGLYRESDLMPLSYLSGYYPQDILEKFVNMELKIIHVHNFITKKGFVKKSLTLGVKVIGPASPLNDGNFAEGFDFDNINEDYNDCPFENPASGNYSEDDYSFMDNLNVDNEYENTQDSAGFSPKEDPSENETENMEDFFRNMGTSNDFNGSDLPPMTICTTFPSVKGLFADVKEADIAIPSIVKDFNYASYNYIPYELETSDFDSNGIFVIANISFKIGVNLIHGQFVIKNTISGLIYDFIVNCDLDDAQFNLILVRWIIYTYSTKYMSI